MRTDKREKNFHVYDSKAGNCFFFSFSNWILPWLLSWIFVRPTGQDGALFLTVANFPWSCSFGVPTRMLKLVFMLQLQSNLIILNVPIRIITAWHSFPSDMGAVLENSWWRRRRHLCHGCSFPRWRAGGQRSSATAHTGKQWAVPALVAAARPTRCGSLCVRQSEGSTVCWKQQRVVAHHSSARQ